MSTFTPLIIWTATMALCWTAASARSQSRVSDNLQPADARSCYFAGGEALLLFAWTSPNGDDEAAPEELHVAWSLTSQGRTLATGAGPAKVHRNAGQMRYQINLSLPPVRPGVVLPVQFNALWTHMGREFQFSRPLYIFARDPFSAQQALMLQAQIQLYDPEGRTTELLKQHSIPHSRLANISAIDRTTEGVVLVGEGISLGESRSLPDALVRAAQRGVGVLCLAPVEGDFPLPGPGAASSFLASRIALEREEVVRRYDKRFDVLPPLRRFSLQSRRNAVVVGATEDEHGWSWLELDFAAETLGDEPNKLIVCGVSIVEQWDESPVPRYLFLRLLEELAPAGPPKEMQEDASTQN